MAHQPTHIQPAPANQSQNLAASGPGQKPTPEIDLPALAQKIYDLFKRELRLEYERQGLTKFQ